MAVSFFGTAATLMATLPTPSFATNLNQQIEIYLQGKETQETMPKEVAPPEPKQKRLICKRCNQNETYVLNALQKEGITDKVAIATIMGNIRQESMFIPNICGNGSRVPYHRCYGGGFGIIQFSDSTRFYGLGRFAKKYGGDPSTIETQVKYMFYETDWKRIKNRMSRPGGTVNDYMRLAYKWIRWGHEGPRRYYAQKYLNKFTYEDS